jgi:hypothetical protein
MAIHLLSANEATQLLCNLARTRLDISYGPGGLLLAVTSRAAGRGAGWLPIVLDCRCPERVEHEVVPLTYEITLPMKN